MVLQTDEAVKVYRELAKLPTIVSGSISNQKVASHIQVQSVWSQRNLERSEVVKYSRSHVIQLDIVVSNPPQELSNVQWNKQSPSGQFIAIVRKWTDKKGNEKQFLEIWSGTHQLQNIDVTALDRHGKIYDDSQFGCLEWSYSETHLLYVAEKKPHKTKSYFDAKPDDSSPDDESKATKGDEYLLKESWGEQLVENCNSVLCVLDIEAGCISLLKNLPDNVSPGQAVWCPDDLGVVCVGWDSTPYRLGLVYCVNRRSTLYHIDLKTFSCNPLGPVDRAVRSPVFSPDQTKLIFLENSAGGPHGQCCRLMMCDWSTKGILPVVEVVRRAAVEEFQGLFCQRLASRCWSSDSKRIVVDTAWRSKHELIVVDVESGRVTRLTNDKAVGNWTLLDIDNNIDNDIVLAACSSVNRPPYLVIGHLPVAGKETEIRWTPLDSEPTILSDIEWSIHQFSAPAVTNEASEFRDYEYLLINSVGDQQAPLVSFVHGGPHSVISADFFLNIAALCRCGYSIVVANYRGSTGFGQDGIESLLGKIGDQDVKDVQNVVESVVKQRGNAENVVVIGGSHGGFLTAHAIGQYPDFYKAAVARNPVIDLNTMLGASDIPDWIYTESGYNFNMKSEITPEILTAFHKKSPISHVDKMKTPLLVCIGGKDLRVPPSQGLEIAKELRARQKEVRIQFYPDCNHPLAEVASEADAFINIVKWFNSHLYPSSVEPVEKTNE